MANLKPPSDPIDTRLVRRLADILRDTELSEIEVEKGDLKIRVARAAPVAGAPAAVYAPPQAAPAPAPALAALVPAATVSPAPPPAPPEPSGDAVKSPMVGTVYLQPQPGADPFVRVGDRVREGQTLLIIEAMKTMNPIPAPRDGVIASIVVGDGQPVEYGEPLVVLAQ